MQGQKVEGGRQGPGGGTDVQWGQGLTVGEKGALEAGGDGRTVLGASLRLLSLTFPNR